MRGASECIQWDNSMGLQQACCQHNHVWHVTRHAVCCIAAGSCCFAPLNNVRPTAGMNRLWYPSCNIQNNTVIIMMTGLSKLGVAAAILLSLLHVMAFDMKALLQPQHQCSPDMNTVWKC